MIVLTVSVTLLLLYLIFERLSVNRWRRSIPMVITVTGTRGKSSVTRLLAAVLRESGRKVLAKTTGSEATLLLPDGTEAEIRRRGPASIIEQSTLLKQAARQNVDCLVAEVMSIHPENHLVESQQILKPDIVIVTNVWPDHVDASGQTEGDTALALSLDIPKRATVFALENLCMGVFEAAAVDGGGHIVKVPFGNAASVMESMPDLAGREFAENVDLVHTLVRHLGVTNQAFVDGLKAARPDIGALRIWDWRNRNPERHYLVVNGFAANDPESTRRVIAKVQDMVPSIDRPPVGLLCLRADRGDRTQQWIDALKHGAASQFSRLYVTGGHARVVARRLESAEFLGSRSPKMVMETLVAEVEDRAVVFGFGNIAGLGRQLVDYWNRTGVVRGV